jgi:septum formation protein
VPPPRIILASSSPQRQALLKALGVEFDVGKPMIDELTEGDPRELVLENARWKAAAVAAKAKPGTLVIAGDTEVVLDGRALGQPKDEEDARGHLEALSGREHEVLGAIALLGPDQEDGRPRTREGMTRRGGRGRARG